MYVKIDDSYLHILFLFFSTKFFRLFFVYEAFQAVSIRLWPSLFLILFIQLCYGWPQKDDLQQFPDFFENFFGSHGRNRREIRAVIDSFETYTINSLMKKNIFETNFIVSRALFRVAQPKQTKLKWFFFRLRCNGNIPCA